MVNSIEKGPGEVEGIWAKKQVPQLALSELCPRDRWQRIKDATRCSVARCEKKFAFWDRRHNCRQCGRVVCSSCSRDRIVVGCYEQEDKLREVRVCRDCSSDNVKHASPVSVGSSPHSISSGSHSGSHSGSLDSESDFINFTLTAGALNPQSDLTSFRRRTFAEQKRSTSDSNIAAAARAAPKVAGVRSKDEDNSPSVRWKDPSVNNFPIKTIDETTNSTSESGDDGGTMISFFHRRRGSGGAKGFDTSPKSDTIPRQCLPYPGMCFQWSEGKPGNGLFRAFGTNCGRSRWHDPAERGLLKVHSSVWREGSPQNVLDPNPRSCWSASDPLSPAWICIELPDSIRFTPNGYSLRHGYIGGGELRNWILLGSEDGILWIPLSTHTDDTSLAGPYCVKFWPIKDAEVGYRFFKVGMLGKNDIGGHQLSCSGFEMYGSVAQRSDMVDSTHWLFSASSF